MNYQLPSAATPLHQGRPRASPGFHFPVRHLLAAWPESPADPGPNDQSNILLASYHHSTLGTRKCPDAASGASASAVFWPSDGGTVSSRDESVASPSGVSPPSAGRTLLVATSFNCST